MTKPSYLDFFAGKTVTLMGLGILGRGVGDAAFLARVCKKVYVTDTKSTEALRVSVDALKEYTNIEFVLGGHDTRIFEKIDFVIKGAGVGIDNPFIAHAEENHVPIYMSTALFAFLSPLKVIGITGTRGKTTTTCMIAEILKAAGQKVLLGGNIRGVSTLSMLAEADHYDVAVLELDSWQLQGFDSLCISPEISVFTNFYPDHMNYYDGDMDRYLHDKAAIFRHQKKEDATVTTADMDKILTKERAIGPGLSDWILAPPLSPEIKLHIPGAHNLHNAGLAAAAAQRFGTPDHVIKQALETFSAVEGRLQFAGTWQGRDFYNDSNATTQEATLAALTAFPADKVVLIFGGSDKGLSMDQMTAYLADHKIKRVLIKGTGSDRILQRLPDTPVVETMQAAVQKAVDLSTEGDHIILSPAFASFGVFKNEYDRSDQFMQEVRARTESEPASKVTPLKKDAT